jgi:hypothetical protein
MALTAPSATAFRADFEVVIQQVQNFVASRFQPCSLGHSRPLLLEVIEFAGKLLYSTRVDFVFPLKLG